MQQTATKKFVKVKVSDKSKVGTPQQSVNGKKMNC